MPPDLDANTRLALERTGLAHERTLMGWVRTCVSMISFGFSVYAFFLSLEGSSISGEGFEKALRACLVLTLGGTLFMALALVQNILSVRKLRMQGMQHRVFLSILASILVCAAGITCTYFILS